MFPASKPHQITYHVALDCCKKQHPNLLQADHNTTGPSPLNRKHSQGWAVTCSDRSCEKNILSPWGTTNWAQHMTGSAGGEEDVVEHKHREWNTCPSMSSPPWQRHKKKLLFWNIFKNCGAKSRHRETTVPLFYEGAPEKPSSQPSADETAEGHTEQYSKN